MENKEAKTNVTNEELMQKIEELEKELKRANSNIVLVLTTLATVYAYKQVELEQKVEEGTATNIEKEINELYGYADVAIDEAIKEHQRQNAEESKDGCKYKEFKSFGSIIDSIFGF